MARAPASTPFNRGWALVVVLAFAGLMFLRVFGYKQYKQMMRPVAPVSANNIGAGETRQTFSDGRFVSVPSETKRPTPAKLGELVTLSVTTICMPTKEGLDEIVKWAVRKDTEEMARTMLRDGGSLINSGETVKVLDPGILHTKIRASTGECWATPETIR